MSAFDFAELRMYAESDPAMFSGEVRTALLDAVEAAHRLRSSEDTTDEAWLDFALARFDFPRAGGAEGDTQ